ncbi:MAG: hypothetical protein GY928_20765 [Colwellia sp.]|nr:hypothetical protein [Colwellia sp.]
MRKVELVPCPFCSEQFGEPNFLVLSDATYGCAQCPTCGACGPGVEIKTKDIMNGWGKKAIDAWNWRLL